jgi:XRE family transcriptional regulator, fatty acid utilization regulator
MPGPDVTAVFAASLGRRRRERGLSQKDLAAAAGISPSALSLIECGRNGPSLATAVALARELGTGVDAMLGETEPESAYGAGTAAKNGGIR